MEFECWHYVVKAEIKLTLAEVGILMEVGQQHYDARCRMESGLGGFLWGWRRQLELSEFMPVIVQFREVDTCCKILEQSDPDNPAHLGLVVELRRLLMQLSDEHKRINTPVD